MFKNIFYILQIFFKNTKNYTKKYLIFRIDKTIDIIKTFIRLTKRKKIYYLLQFCSYNLKNTLAAKPTYVYNNRVNSYPTIVTGKILNVPHYYEFNPKENPNRYWWCGQTAFRMTIKAFGITKTPNEIHKGFNEVDQNYKKKKFYYENNCGYGNKYKWCAYPGLFVDTIEWYGKNRIGNLKAKREEYYSEIALFEAVKKAIDNKQLMILYSQSYYSNGWVRVKHFMVVNGYSTSYSKIEKKELEDHKIVFVRDPVQEKSGGSNFDKHFKASELWNNAYELKPNGSKMVVGVIVFE